MKIKKTLALILAIAIALAATLSLASCATDEKSPVPPADTTSEVASSQQPEDVASHPLKGKWVGDIDMLDKGKVDLTLNINPDKKDEEILLSSDTWKVYYFRIASTIEKDELNFSMNSPEHLAVIKLKSDGKTLSGTYSQYGETYQLILNKTSDTPLYSKFYKIVPQISYPERKQQLLDFAAYSDDDISIPYTYELNDKSNFKNIIKEYDLDALTDKKTDIELMTTLLNWVCDKFDHDGNSMPVERNANTIIEYAKENNNKINCRALSILLAELCRSYGITAKHITCMPKETNFDDCHVVVEAYSKKLQQWIMLDPTYNLILKDKHDKYINLQALRENLLADAEMIPNEAASYNGSGFSIKSYTEYMTKNTFRFESSTDYYYGSDSDTERENSNCSLLPVGYTEVKTGVVTTSPEAFWIKPETKYYNG